MGMNLDYDDFFDERKLKSLIVSRAREIYGDMLSEDITETAKNARDIDAIRLLAGIAPTGPENATIKEHKFRPDPPQPPPTPPKRILREYVNPVPGISYGKAMAIILLVAIISAAIPTTIYLISNLT